MIMAMASKTVNYWRSLSRAATAGGSSVRGATTAAHVNGQAKLKPRGEYVPVYVALGLILLSVTLGLSTARHQLAHSPNVRVDKKKRETVPEVAEPEGTLDESRRFMVGSVFRKVAHVQDLDAVRAGVSDPTNGHTEGKVVTLKDVGVDPPGIDRSKTGLLDKIFKKN